MSHLHAYGVDGEADEVGAAGCLNPEFADVPQLWAGRSAGWLMESEPEQACCSPHEAARAPSQQRWTGNRMDTADIRPWP